jgi:CRP/FNR family cyclic AMP-dependent transcriptional regulator
MATGIGAPAPQKTLEDPLAHLPRSGILEYPKDAIIYSPDQPATGVYLVVEGKVKVSRLAADGQQVLVDIYQNDEFFGESAFLNLPHRSEQATAIENARLMTWTAAEIEAIVLKRPRLAVAFLQMMAQRSVEFTQRIESFSVDTMSRRLARSLVRLSERFGTPQDDGSVRMIPLTHELLAQYVGTSRELVTQYMNQFRRQGYLRYSRKSIIVFRAPFRAWLGQSNKCGVSRIPLANARGS